MKQLTTFTLKEAVNTCVANDNYLIGVFCPSERIAKEAFDKGYSTVKEMIGNEKAPSGINADLGNYIILFPNGSIIRYIYKAESVPMMNFNEIMFHGWLLNEEYGDTLRILQLVEQQAIKEHRDKT